MTALLDVLAGTARLSRRDRAALALALECVRAGDGVDTWHALDCAGGGLSVAVLGALQHADAALYDPRGRVIRARLALLLRLVLRCDRGDPPPAWWVAWGGHRYGFPRRKVAEWAQRGCIERIVPLWEQAPATRAR